MKKSLKYRRSHLRHKLGFQHQKECVEISHMRKTIRKLDGGCIRFNIIQDKNNGDWAAESINIPGIITGGNKQDDIDAMIKDAILTYFAIPPQHCDDIRILSMQEIYKEALDYIRRETASEAAAKEVIREPSKNNQRCYTPRTAGAMA